jgi:hypothetical protein
MLRLAVQQLLLPAVVFLVSRRFLGNGDALLVAVVAHAVAEARRRWRSFEACAPSLTKGMGPWPSWPATPARVGSGRAWQVRRPS